MAGQRFGTNDAPELTWVMNTLAPAFVAERYAKSRTEVLDRCRNADATPDLLRPGVEATDCNAAFFDAANGFRGCIAGLHEVLRRQGLLEGIWCLDDQETLSAGQLAEIDRVYHAYPHLHDDEFVAAHRHEWLR